MRVLIQRVSQASVKVSNQVVGEIDQGLLVLICAQPADTPEVHAKIVHKILNLRVFEDEQGKMNQSIQDISGGLLLVSQFTLVADVSRGNRPSFVGAAPHEQARRDYEHLLALARSLHPVVAAGVFGADMKVSLINDGPVTIPIEILS